MKNAVMFLAYLSWHSSRITQSWGTSLSVPRRSRKIPSEFERNF